MCRQGVASASAPWLAQQQRDFVHPGGVLHRDLQAWLSSELDGSRPGLTQTAAEKRPSKREWQGGHRRETGTMSAQRRSRSLGQGNGRAHGRGTGPRSGERLEESSPPALARTNEVTPTLLLVDDEGYHRNRLGGQFEALGHRVSYEKSKDGALACVRSMAGGIACVEPVLKGHCWYTFLRLLRQTGPSLDLVVVTEFASTSLEIEARNLGALDLLRKPVDAADVIAAVQGRGRRRDVEPDLSLARAEWEHVNRVLQMCSGNVSEASRRLRIPRQSLYNKLRKAPG
jgi:two-component system, response regulator RegA